MRRRVTLLINLAIVLSLAFSGTLSGILIPSPVATGTSSTPAITSGQASPELASRRVKRERKHDRTQQNRKQDRKQKDRKADHKRQDKKHNPRKGHKKDQQPTEQGRVGDWQDQCNDPSMVRLAKTELCTHGPDPMPAAFALGQATESSAPVEAQDSAPIACESDGQTGFRVQVLYVRGTSSPALSADRLAAIRGWVADMDQIYQDNAETTGPSRNIRFVHAAGDPCQPAVDDVTVTSAALNDFDSMISQLENKGYDKADRIYLSFVNANTYCGIGTLWDDDNPDGAANWNNFGPSYSRVDAKCWAGWVAAHEVMHNLGGVQLSAEHTSNGFHCIDEYDIMCYDDGPASPPMREICTPEALYDDTLLDCNHDDYYNTDPVDGSYLDNHWNPANNRFLIGGTETELPTDSPSLSVEWVAPVGNDETFDVSDGRIALSAEATDDTGVKRVEFWRFNNETGDWEFISEDDTAPYESSIDAEALGPGVNYLSADAYGPARRYGYALIQLNKSSPTVAPPPVDPPPIKHKKDKKKKGKHKKKKRR